MDKTGANYSNRGWLFRWNNQVFTFTFQLTQQALPAYQPTTAPPLNRKGLLHYFGINGLRE